MRLIPHDPVTHVIRAIPPEEAAHRIWVEFRLRPVATDEPSQTTVSILGAKLAFLTADGHGEVFAYDEATHEPLFSGISFSPGEWLRFTFEVAGEYWRLHKEGSDFTGWLGRDADSSWALHWFGDGVDDVFLDDLRVAFGGIKNPFVTSSSAPESSTGEISGGIEAHSSDGGVSSTGDSSNFASGTFGGENFGTLSAGGPMLIYVNAATGNDSNDGETELTAKATIAGGIAAVANDGVLIVQGGIQGFTLGTINPAGKNITIRPTGNIIIR